MWLDPKGGEERGEIERCVQANNAIIRVEEDVKKFSNIYDANFCTPCTFRLLPKKQS